MIDVRTVPQSAVDWFLSKFPEAQSNVEEWKKNGEIIVDERKVCDNGNGNQKN
jgi:hypothetical protein